MVSRLETMLICILDSTLGIRHVLRVLLDSGSTHSFIVKSCSTELHLREISNNLMSISTFGEPSQRKQCATVQARIFRNFKSCDFLDLNLIEIDQICKSIPSYDLSVEQTQYIKNHNIVLADPEASHSGNLEIDMLIGQDYYHSFVKEGRMELPGGLILQPSNNRSYILSGRSATPTKVNSLFTQFRPAMTAITIPFDSLKHEDEVHTLDQFSNLEAIGISPVETEISPVLEEFNTNTIHNGKRYVVKLPWKIPKRDKLATNFSLAFNRLVSSHKRNSKEKYKLEYEKYSQIMQEQLEEGILEKVQSLGTIQEVYKTLAENPNAYDRLAVNFDNNIVHYLPHHGVYKASTNKLRVVYDAAAKPGKGEYSLNDCLEPGPNLMNSLVHILIKFRLGKFACKADIRKAFLQVEIDENDRDALRLLWLDNGIVWVYRFARLPFGLTCAPFILAAVLQKHLGDSSLEEDLMFQILASFYVDDNIWSTDSFDDLIKRVQSSTITFNEAGMDLRDWNSNNSDARKRFSENREDDLPTSETVLGLRWNLETDNISINVERILDLVGQIPKTKRKFWRFISKLYDPLGLLAPYTVIAKLLCRLVSSSCKGWDSILPKDLAEKVGKWMNDFIHVADIQLPRYIGLENGKSQKLVGFCDASNKAIAACVYLVTSDGKSTVSHLVMAKTRLTPTPAQSISRLELISAQLLVNLMTCVRKAVKELSDDNIFYFTDSSNVLYWLHSGSYNWPVFVANRIYSIRKASNIKQWYHVSTSENPADLPSRGCHLSELKDQSLWWFGPEFIKRDILSGKSKVKGYDKIYTHTIPPGCESERKTIINTISITKHIDKASCDISKLMDISRFGSYDKLLSVTGKVLQFCELLMCKIKRKPCGVLNEFGTITTKSELLWIQATQRLYFKDLFALLNNPKSQVSATSRSLFKDHRIFLDKEMGILRCKTRISESLHSFATANPILIPAISHFTTLLIYKAHSSLGHQGVPNTLSHLRAEFWILQGRRSVQKIIRRCNKCRKVDGPAYSMPPHPPLPAFRVRRARAFNSVGIDFTGPFFVKNDITGDKFKAYMLLFSCAVTRAVHLEATQSMSVNDFLLAMQRFMNIRGIPENIESDNAKTFVRANIEFKSIFGSKRAAKFFDQKRINWHFYVEEAPWQGGFIEKINHLFKRICKRTFGKAMLTFEEFRSMVSYAMGILNDRPLTFVYSDILSEGTSLSPSMLMMGYNLCEPPHLSLRKRKDEDELTLSDKYKFLEKLKDKFWNLWHDQYLTELYEKHIKQGKSSGNPITPKIGDVVLIKGGEHVPRRQWRLGRVLDAKASKRDNQVRACKVQTLSPQGRRSFITRSPSFLVPLECESEYYSDTPTLKSNNSTISKTKKKVRFDVE